MATPTFKSYNQIFGDMARKMLSVTGLNDMYKGSVLSTLLESAAQEDFAQYGALIDVLNNFALDSTTGADLDKKAAEYGLTRATATTASGFVTLGDSSFSKISTGIYIGASPPITGDTAIKVTDATDIAANYVPGITEVYVGRGTSNFEGPIPLSGAPVNNVSYWTLPVATIPLSKNHNLSETVIMAQGGNRIIPAGTTVKVAANNVSSEVLFSTSSDQVLADGENALANVLVYASQPGTTGNVPLGAITAFSTAPFSGATVTNSSAFSNARDLETDQELRDRIKATIQSLSKGTSSAIISGVVGVTDPDENKRVASASLAEPTLVTDIAKLYIDDGTGFEPSYAGQGLETLILEAAGTEQFLQLGNFPLVKAQVESVESQPYALVNGHTLSVKINDTEETLTFLTSDFAVSGAATALEVAAAINNRATIFEARTTNGQKNVVIFARTINNEKIQVTGGTANEYLLFPTDPIYTLKLYKNEQLLSKDGETAFLESDEQSVWGAISSPSTLNIQIDGKPMQYIRVNPAAPEMEVSLDNANWVTVSGTAFIGLGVTAATATVTQWAFVLNQMISGATVTANGSKIKITSNVENLAVSQVHILGGNLVGSQGWSTDASVGKASDYSLNRFNGQIELNTPLVADDRVTTGSLYTRAQLISNSAAGGSFDLSAVGGRQPILYVVVDGISSIKTVNLTLGGNITVSNTGGNTYRYTTGSAAFANLIVNDYIVVVDRGGGAGILSSVNCGIFKVTDVDGAYTWFEATNPLGVIEGPIVINETTDIQAFSSDTPPQKVQFTAAVTTVQSVADQINKQMSGALAEALDDDTVRFYTNSYNDDIGSLHIPVAIGNASLLLGFSSSRVTSAPSHIAAIQSLSQLGFRIVSANGSITTNDTTDPYTDVWDATRTFTVDGLTQPGQWVKYITGNNKDVKGVIRTIVGNTQLLLRDNVVPLPTPQTMVDPDFLNSVTIGDVYQQFVPFDLEDTDNLVVVLDDNEADKTYNVQMARRGRVNVRDTTSTFDALDTDAAAAGTDFGGSLWLGYDFADYKVWFKSRQVVNPTNNKNALIIRSKKYGPTGDKIRLTFTYSLADTALSASLASSDTASSVTVSLGTDVERVTTQDASTQFDITTVPGVTTTYTWDGTGSDPGFGVVATGDIVMFNCANFNSSNNGIFKISATNNIDFITVLNTAGVVESNKVLGLASAMSIYPLLGNTGLTVRNIINNTNGVKDVVEAVLTSEDPFGTVNDGSGSIEYSTSDDPAIASQWISLVDGENWIRDFNNLASPQFTLKEALSFINVVGGAGDIYSIETAPVYGTTDVGEPFRLIPTTAKNVLDHMNKAAITAISLNALIQRSDDGNKIQIASLEVGSEGSVRISGGLGNSNYASAQSNAIVNGTSLKVPILTSMATGFHVGQDIRVQNLRGTNKPNTYGINTSSTITEILVGTTYRHTLNDRITGINVTSTFTVTNPSPNVYRYTVAVAGDFLEVHEYDELNVTAAGAAAGNVGTFPIINVDVAGAYVDVINPGGFAPDAFGVAAASDVIVAVPFFTVWPHEATAATTIRIEKLSQDVVRYRRISGPSPNFVVNGLAMDDYIEITDTNISTANQGTFVILDVSADSFSVVNPSAVEEEVALAAATGLVCKYVNSVLTGDILNVGAIGTAWFSETNQGAFSVTSVGRDVSGFHYVEIANALGIAEPVVVFGTNYGSFLVLEGTPFTTYRKINNMCINEINNLLTDVYISSALNPNRFATSAGTRIYTLNKLGFPEDPVGGIDGYKYWTGLQRRVQRTVDGYDSDPLTYPGIKAAGVQIEVTPPLLQNVSIGLDVRTISGVPLSVLIDSVKSAVLSYVNSLGVGDDVILSQIVKKVQEVPGIEAVRIVDPAPVANQAPERITIQDNERAICYEENVTVG